MMLMPKRQTTEQSVAPPAEASPSGRHDSVVTIVGARTLIALAVELDHLAAVANDNDTARRLTRAAAALREPSLPRRVPGRRAISDETAIELMAAHIAASARMSIRQAAAYVVADLALAGNSAEATVDRLRRKFRLRQLAGI